MNRSRTLTVLAPLASLVLLLAACSSTASPAASTGAEATTTPASQSQAATSEEPAAGEERVRLVNSQFDPTELTISAGTEVVFLNADGFAHTVTEGTDGQAVDDPIVDEDLDQGGSASVTFDEAGTFEITCELHPSMQMTITVEG